MTDMNDSEFRELIEQKISQLEDRLEDADIDYDVSGSILTVEFDNGTQIIVSPQISGHELWLAATSGGFHYAWNGEDWISTRDEGTFDQKLIECCSSQGESYLEI
ncbi:iron donor protein CyaY [Pelagibaculum spongiae]|nr:iron donor protein CyaY [Pelagibaculum spongiae]